MGNPGDENQSTVITNGNFQSGYENWLPTNGMNINAGKLLYSATWQAWCRQYPIVPDLSLRWYRCKFTIYSITNCHARQFLGQVYGPWHDSPGTYIDFIQPDSPYNRPYGIHADTFGGAASAVFDSAFLDRFSEYPAFTLELAKSKDLFTEEWKISETKMMLRNASKGDNTNILVNYNSTEE